MKSEADCYSINDLKRDKRTLWTEIRNYQARNFMRDMKIGDKILFYHSNAGAETGVVGEAKVSKNVVPDPTQFDKNGEYFDAKATKENPRWECVEVAFKSVFSKIVTLQNLKTEKQFSDMVVVRPGSRLSITPVQKVHYDKIVKKGNG